MNCKDCMRYDTEECPHRMMNSEIPHPLTMYYNSRVINNVVESFCEMFWDKSIPVHVTRVDAAVGSDVTGHSELILKDSGERREFETGAVRDIVRGKGRCDLMPLHIVAVYLDGDCVIEDIGKFLDDGEVSHLFAALKHSVGTLFDDKPTAVLEAAKQYEAGADKYGEHNWEKGIPVHSYIDSAVRHYLKCLRKDNDEPHDRAFVWNIFGAIWTIVNKPEMNDIKYLNDLK